MASLTLDGSRFSGIGCLVAAKILLGLKILFWDLVTIECVRVVLVGGAGIAVGAEVNEEG